MTEPHEVQLHACPFCGSVEVSLWHDDDPSEERVFVECEDCQTRGPIARIGCRDEEEAGIDLETEAARFWNQRSR